MDTESIDMGNFGMWMSKLGELGEIGKLGELNTKLSEIIQSKPIQPSQPNTSNQTGQTGQTEQTEQSNQSNQSNQSSQSGQTNASNQIEELKNILNVVKNLNLPNHQKIAIESSILCAMDVIGEKITYTEMTYSKLQNIVNRDLGIKAVCFDKNYRTTDIKTLEKMLTSTLDYKIKYVNDLFDCDNFAKYVSSTMALEFGINTVGEAVGMIFIFKDGVFSGMGLHAFNAVVTADRCVLYEPQLNKFIEGHTLKVNDVTVVYIPFSAVFG